MRLIIHIDGGAVAAGAMDERRIAALGGDGVEELIGDRGIGHAAIERNPVVANAGFFGGGGFGVEVGAGLAGLAQIDDGCKAHLLQLGHGGGFHRAGAGDGRFQSVEIGDAVDRFLG